MKQKNTLLSLAVGTAFAATAAMAPLATAAENPFGMTKLSSGYLLADAHDKMKEGKCGEGKCGADKKKEGKCGEGKCGADKMKEGKCGEGKCGADKKKEGSCGGDKMKEGKCGGDKKEAK